MCYSAREGLELAKIEKYHAPSSQVPFQLLTFQLLTNRPPCIPGHGRSGASLCIFHADIDGNEIEQSQETPHPVPPRQDKSVQFDATVYIQTPLNKLSDGLLPFSIMTLYSLLCIRLQYVWILLTSLV